MESRLSADRTQLTVSYQSRDELDALLERARTGDVILRLADRLDEGWGLFLEATAGARRVKVPARVKQVFRSGTELHGTMFELDLGALEEDAIEEPEPADSEESEPDDDSKARARVAAGGETFGASTIFEIRELTPPKRMLLAMKASRPQRQILLRDNSPQVLLALLSNPRLETRELLELLKNTNVQANVLQRIANDQRFAGNQQVQLALVRNPRTPQPIAIRLLEVVPTKELRKLAKSQKVREAVKKAALRVYLKRQ